MLDMPDLKTRTRDEWITAQATVTSIKKRLLPWKNGGAMDYPLPEYVVTFARNVGGRVLTGSYVTTSPQQSGHTFEIFYDPKHPSRPNNSLGLSASVISMLHSLHLSKVVEGDLAWP